MKRILLFVLAVTMTLCSAMTAFAADNTRVPFLLYHSVTDSLKEDDDQLLHITKEMFSEHMNALKSSGYNTITLDDYYAFATQNKPLPPKPIVLCFDDGYENNYTNAFPILQDLGMKATIFVIASRVGDHTVKYPHFTWEQALEMERSGVMNIQSHTMTHPSFYDIDYAQTVREMRMSKYLVEKNMNKTCDYMAYPYGHTNAFSAEVGQKCGYKLMCIVGNSGTNGADADLSAVRRLNVPAFMDSRALLEYIEENY